MVLKIMKSKDSKTNSVPVSVIKTTWSEHPRPYLWHSNRDITEFQFITSVLSANALCQYFTKLIWKILHYLTEKKERKRKGSDVFEYVKVSKLVGFINGS